MLSSLDANGQPTPLIECLVRPPESRMGIINTNEMTTLIQKSMLMPRYGQRLERDSAKEMLAARKEEKNNIHAAPTPRIKTASNDPSMLETLSKNTLFRQVMRQGMRDIMRMLLSVIGGKKR